MKHTPRAIRGAYDYARTDIPCPTCGAEPYAFCVQAGGIHRHIPCVARLEKREDPNGPDTPPPVLRIIRNTDTEEDQ